MTAKRMRQLLTATGALFGLTLAGCAQAIPATPSAAPGAVDCDAGQTITAALATAQPNDTVTVSGTCHETLWIKRGLTGVTLTGTEGATIVGPPASTPATSPASFTIFIEADGVTVRNLTIVGGAHAVHLSGPALATIDSNVIKDSGGAIHLDKMSIGQILGNTIVNNYYGINLQEDSYARIGFRIPTLDAIPGNVIRDNTGPAITIGQRSSAWIMGNTIVGNGGDGVWVNRDSQADIVLNDIAGNAGDGVNALQGAHINLSGEGTAKPEAAGNTSSTPNRGVGIRCSVDGYVAGPLAGLAGTQGDARITEGCTNRLTRK